MKKMILLAFGYNAFTSAAEVPIPQNVRNNFESTCQNIKYNGKTLSAECQNNNQQIVSTSIDVNIDENTEIHNCNGNFCLGICFGMKNICLQQQLTNLQQKLATTKDILTKISLKSTNFRFAKPDRPKFNVHKFRPKFNVHKFYHHRA